MLAHFKSISNIIVLLAAFTIVGAGQNNQGRPQKVAITECEGVNNCTTWTFMRANGKTKGYAKWSTGEEAVVEIESQGADRITISRTDATGSKQGLTGTYKGVVHGRNVGGEYESTYNGQSDSGNWYWVNGDSQAANLPTEMHFCGQGCFALHLNGGLYKTTDGHGTWTVRKFDGKSFSLDRADAGGFVGYYRGDILNNHLVNIASGGRPFTPDWQPGPDTRYNNVIITWGTELNTIPGDGGRSPLNGGPAPTWGISLSDIGQLIRIAHDGAETLKIINDLSSQH